MADLVILDANPIEKITSTMSVFAVIRNGKLISKKEIDNLKSKLKTKSSTNEFKLRR